MRVKPPDPDDLNTRRAEWALMAVTAFARETGQSLQDERLEEILGDLLVDLAHLADRTNTELAALIRGAAEMYREETAGLGKQFESRAV